MIREYKCPNCNGALSFDSSIQKMKCPYCDAEFEINALDEYQREQAVPAQDNFGWETDGAGKIWDDKEMNDLSSGACPSCGAELVGDTNTIAMVCPCCGNAQIVQKQIEGLLKPDFVIPFQLEKKDAVAALKKFYAGKRLLPDFFREENRVNSIQGLYVPFWLFDAQAQGYIRYKVGRTMGWSDSKYHYTKTDFYSVVREGSLDFAKIPVDGSEKMDDRYMDAIEPFDYTQLSPFQSAYLAGYSAEKYDVDAETGKERAKLRIKSTMETEFGASVRGYTSVITENSAVNVAGGTVHYALFPVWILNTTYKKEHYQFIMNGQSGRFVGSLPADSGKSWKYRLMFTGIFGVIFTIAIQLVRLFM